MWENSCIEWPCTRTIQQTCPDIFLFALYQIKSLYCHIVLLKVQCIKLLKDNGSYRDWKRKKLLSNWPYWKDLYEILKEECICSPDTFHKSRWSAGSCRCCLQHLFCGFYHGVKIVNALSAPQWGKKNGWAKSLSEPCHVFLLCFCHAAKAFITAWVPYATTQPAVNTIPMFPLGV